MELSSSEQILAQIKKANRILIALPASPSPDSLSAGVALKLFLEKQNKAVEIACAGPQHSRASFLPALELVKQSLPDGKNLIISVDTSKKKLEEISYETSPEKINIFLKAGIGQFVPEDVSFGGEKALFDLIFVLDSPSLLALGKLFEENTEIFFETAKINIDHKPENEFFGAINLVDLVATSTSEILANLFDQIAPELQDENIATCLLTGIIFKTDSFQHAKTTPRAFLLASRLVEKGGRQQQIVEALYKTKSLNFLRLWGRSLAKLKSDNSLALYAVLNLQDFEKADAGTELLPQVVADLLINISDKRVVGVLAEKKDGVEISVATHKSLDNSKFFSQLGVFKDKVELSPHAFWLANFHLPSVSLVQAEEKFLFALKNF